MPIGLAPGNSMHHIAFFWSLPVRLAAHFRAQTIDAWRAQVIQANLPLKASRCPLLRVQLMTTLSAGLARHGAVCSAVPQLE
jgi:hypothetical protein